MFSISEGQKIVTTWANKPANGIGLTPFLDRVFCPDVGRGGSEWYWDDGVISGAARYRAVGGQVALKNDATGASATTATTETKMMGFVVPAGILQSGDLVRVEWKLQKTTAESIVVNQLIQIHNTDSFQAMPVSTQNASLVSGTYSSYEFLDWKIIDQTHIKTLSASTATGYGNGGGNNNPDRAVSDLSTNAITIGIYAKYASAPSTSTVICENMTVTLRTCG